MSLNLEKGGSVNLSKDVGQHLTNIRVALGWDAAAKKGFFNKLIGGGEIDLDASAIMVSQGKVSEIVYFGKLTSNDGSVRHTGDNLTGAGDGDDESILVHLDQVSNNIDTIVFVVNSYSGQSFSTVANAYVRVVDSADNDKEVARFDLSNFGNYTGMIMATLKRNGSEWILNAVGDPANGHTAQDISHQAVNY